MLLFSSQGYKRKGAHLVLHVFFALKYLAIFYQILSKNHHENKYNTYIMFILRDDIAYTEIHFLVIFFIVMNITLTEVIKTKGRKNIPPSCCSGAGAKVSKQTEHVKTELIKRSNTHLHLQSR